MLKKKFAFYAQSISPVTNLNIKEKSYYLQIPNTVDSKLIAWAKDHKINKSELEFAEFLMDHFKSQNYFYNLKPNPIGNNYSKFFFETKEGYCEYFAGTMALLLRAADIPSRIVTGYYGGRYNNLGDFYTFSQEDAHSWVEVWISNTGWIRFDPTQVIPPSNIKNTINSFEREENNIAIEQNEFVKFFGDKGLNLWVKYIDYQWTNFLINYDSDQRSKLISQIKSLDQTTIFEIIKYIILSITLLIFAMMLFVIITKKNYSDLLFFLIIKKLKLKVKNYETHQDIISRANITDPLKNIILIYEETKFYKKNLSLIKFISIFYDLLKISAKKKASY